MPTLLRTITTHPTRQTLARVLLRVAEWFEPQPEQTELLESFLIFNNWVR